jgi:hypothetical protein
MFLEKWLYLKNKNNKGASVHGKKAKKGVRKKLYVTKSRESKYAERKWMWFFLKKKKKRLFKQWFWQGSTFGEQGVTCVYSW